MGASGLTILQHVGSYLVPQPGIKPASRELEGGFLTTGPPGKSLLRRTEDKLTVCTAEGQVQEHILKLVKLGTKWAQGWLCRGAAFAAAVKSRAPHLVNDLLSPS